MRALIVGKMPDQLKLPFYLWTRAAVAALIRRTYGLIVSLITVGLYLKAWGLSPQKLVCRAYERQDEAITRWLTQEYPALARHARRERAALYWEDEMGLRSDHVPGRSYAPVGQTPITRATGQRFGCNMISAMTNKGSWCFRAVSCTGLCAVPHTTAQVRSPSDLSHCGRASCASLRRRHAVRRSVCPPTPTDPSAWLLSRTESR